MDEQSIQLGPIILDPATRMLLISDSAIFLRNMEYALLRYMMENSNKILSRTRILEDVWDRNICWPTNTIDVHISSLRQKMKSLDPRPLIRTVHCIGYVFDA